MALFIEGRKTVFSTLERTIDPGDRTFWFHAASLGEYEQAVPVIEAVKKDFPQHKIVVTFFSPSGYEVKKTSALADVVTYLPLDTPAKVRRFLDLTHPDWALFIKYEFWPNMLQELQERKIPTLLVSGVFRKDQLFFKSYGAWMHRYLKTFRHFFLQDENSRALLAALGFENASVSGDTRFDRVASQLRQDNELPFISEFKKDKLCVVAGSTWPEDESLMLDYINSAPDKIRFIIAPHTLKITKIKDLQDKLKKKTVLYSEKKGKDLSQYSVFIIDTIGLLSKIYSYADIAYVGGAAGDSGLHNILEPATFGVPIIIGKNYSRFPEAEELRKLSGLFSVAEPVELQKIMQKLVDNPSFRQQSGSIAGHFVDSNTGATEKIVHFLRKNSTMYQNNQ